MCVFTYICLYVKLNKLNYVSVRLFLLDLQKHLICLVSIYHLIITNNIYFKSIFYNLISFVCLILTNLQESFTVRVKVIFTWDVGKKENIVKEC